MYARTVLFAPNSAQQYAIWGAFLFLFCYFIRVKKRREKKALKATICPHRESVIVLFKDHCFAIISLCYTSRARLMFRLLFLSFFCTHRLVLGCRISPPMPLHLSHTAQDVKRAFYHIGA